MFYFIYYIITIYSTQLLATQCDSRTKPAGAAYENNKNPVQYP